jgi:hypothetical protein
LASLSSVSQCFPRVKLPSTINFLNKFIVRNWEIRYTRKIPQ